MLFLLLLCAAIIFESPPAAFSSDMRSNDLFLKLFFGMPNISIIMSTRGFGSFRAPSRRHLLLPVFEFVFQVSYDSVVDSFAQWLLMAWAFGRSDFPGDTLNYITDAIRRSTIE